MDEIKKFWQRRLTALETTVIVFMAAALFLAGYGVYRFAQVQILQSQVRSAAPGVYGKVRKQRETIIKAIEAYKAEFGFYPPENVLSKNPLTVDVVNNPLLYELAGTVYNPTNQMFFLGDLEPAEASFVKDFFHRSNFVNCAENDDKVKHFLSLQHSPAKQLHDDPDVFAVGFSYLMVDVPPKLLWEFDFSPWRYNHAQATNNPGKFDIWIEVKANGKVVTIGNWKAVE